MSKTGPQRLSSANVSREKLQETSSKKSLVSTVNMNSKVNKVVKTKPSPQMPVKKNVASPVINQANRRSKPKGNNEFTFDKDQSKVDTRQSRVSSSKIDTNQDR